MMAERFLVDDSVEAVTSFLEAQGCGDGLPLVPPTADRVARMLAGTDREPDDVVAVLAPGNGEATVETIAINAVMAGCKPEYLPVLVAAVEALAEERFNLHGVQTTTHLCAPLLVVHGPLARRLGVNSGYNCFGQGTPANATLGRALRLTMLNVGGAAPGALDRATFGQPGKYSYCVAENEDQSPWEPLHVELGLDRDVSAVTLYAGEAPHNVNDHVSQTAQGILSTIARTMAVLGSNNTWTIGMTDALVVLSPEHAATIAAEGWTKSDVKRFLYENARLPLHWLKLGGAYGIFRWPKWVNTHDDWAWLPVVGEPNDVIVLVAGGAGRHSLFIPSFGPTRAVTRPILRRDGSPVRV